MHKLAYKLDAVSDLMTVPASARPSEAEALAGEHGFTLGFFGDGDDKAFADYFSGWLALEPYLKYGDTHDLLAALGVRLEDGRMARTFLTPRSAAGPNLRYLLTGNAGGEFSFEEATLRLRPAPELCLRSGRGFDDLYRALKLVREEVQALNRPQVIRLFLPDGSREDFIGDGRAALAFIGYEGSGDDVRFSFERMERNAEKAGGVLIEDKSGAKDFLDPDAFPPLFAPVGDGLEAAVIAHVSLSWSRFIPFVEELRNRAGGIYVVQVSLTGAWHTAGLVSVRMLKDRDADFQGLGDRLAGDILDLCEFFDAGVLELRRLDGEGIRRPREDSLWERLASE